MTEGCVSKVGESSGREEYFYLFSMQTRCFCAKTHSASFPHYHDLQGPCGHLYFLSLLLTMSKILPFTTCSLPGRPQCQSPVVRGTKTSSPGRSVNAPREKMKTCREEGLQPLPFAVRWLRGHVLSVLGSHDCPIRHNLLMRNCG